jgi:hypothetical protein
VHRWASARGEDRDDPRLQFAFAAGLGFCISLTAAAVLTELRGHVSVDTDLGVMAGLVAVAAWWMAWAGALVTAGLAWLMLNSFLVSHDATLRWHGPADLRRLVVLVGCTVAVATIRSAQLSVRRRQLSYSILQGRPAVSAEQVMTGERHA